MESFNFLDNHRLANNDLDKNKQMNTDVENRRVFFVNKKINNDNKSTLGKDYVIDKVLLDKQPKSNEIQNKNANSKARIDDNFENLCYTAEQTYDKKLKLLEFQAKEVLYGEKVMCYYPTKILILQYPKLSTDGILIITNARLIFRPGDSNYLTNNNLKQDYFAFPLTFINKTKKDWDPKTPSIVVFEIQCKDGRNFRFKFVEKKQGDASTFFFLLGSSFIKNDKQSLKDFFFAFEFIKYAKKLEETYNGWKLLEIRKEFERQKLPLTDYRFIDNTNFQFCSTYPPYVVVPIKVSDFDIKGSLKFRVNERFPAISYYYEKKKTVLSRCSQVKSGFFSNRSTEDELFLQLLGNPNQIKGSIDKEINLAIYDARPYLSAFANKINGKGYEDTTCYTNCEIYFMDIENIHHVKKVHRELLEICNHFSLTSFPSISFINCGEWLQILSLILNASFAVAKKLASGKSCLVHCSHGWDRTSQIIALVQLLLDPFYRTFEGFMILIEKEWIGFGHQFFIRLGHDGDEHKEKDRSPIFTQFLDCVFQLLTQYPNYFEFNSRFLADINYHSYSCIFGTFLPNCARDIVNEDLPTKTISLWSYLKSIKQKYTNPEYNQKSNLENSLSIYQTLKPLVLWQEYFLQYSNFFGTDTKPNNNTISLNEGTKIQKRSFKLDFFCVIQASLL